MPQTTPISFLDWVQQRQEQKEYRKKGYLVKYGKIPESTYTINGIPPTGKKKFNGEPFVLTDNMDEEFAFANDDNGHREAWRFLWERAKERGETLIPPDRTKLSDLEETLETVKHVAIMAVGIPVLVPAIIVDHILRKVVVRRRVGQQSTRPEPESEATSVHELEEIVVPVRSVSPALGVEGSGCSRHNHPPTPDPRRRSRVATAPHRRTYSHETSTSMADSRRWSPSPVRGYEGKGKGRAVEEPCAQRSALTSA